MTEGTPLMWTSLHAPAGSLVPTLLLGGRPPGGGGLVGSNESEPPRVRTVVVEGRAGSGKSTLLNAIVEAHAFPSFASRTPPNNPPAVAWRCLTLGNDGRLKIPSPADVTRVTALAVRGRRRPSAVTNDSNDGDSREMVFAVAPCAVPREFLERHDTVVGALDDAHHHRWTRLWEWFRPASRDDFAAIVPAIAIDADAPEPTPPTLTLVETRGEGERWEASEVDLFLTVIRVHGETTTVADICAASCRRAATPSPRGVCLNVTHTATTDASTDDTDDGWTSHSRRSIVAAFRTNPTRVRRIVAEAWNIAEENVWWIDGRAALAEALFGIRVPPAASHIDALATLRRAVFQGTPQGRGRAENPREERIDESFPTRETEGGTVRHSRPDAADEIRALKRTDDENFTPPQPPPPTLAHPSESGHSSSTGSETFPNKHAEMRSTPTTVVGKGGAEEEPPTRETDDTRPPPRSPRGDAMPPTATMGCEGYLPVVFSSAYLREGASLATALLRALAGDDGDGSDDGGAAAPTAADAAAAEAVRSAEARRAEEARRIAQRRAECRRDAEKLAAEHQLSRYVPKVCMDKMA